MNFPVDLSFKLLALASQIYIRDSSGAVVGYVRQKMFKLKEDINVYSDENQSRLLYNIKADRVLDFSPQYNFTDASGRFIGAVKRLGMRSIWRANYEVYGTSSTIEFKINEENGWIKVVDSLLGEIPVVGMFTGYLFHPSYLITSLDGSPVARMTKLPAFFEGRFRLEALKDITEAEEARLLLSTLTMALLERSRG